VVGFSGTYHAILGRPAYAKFMVVPNYKYLKLKIPSPKGIIIVGTTFQRAFECDTECFEFVEALIQSERLHAESPSEDQDIPESSKQVPCSFEPAKDIKDAIVSGDVRMLYIGTALDPIGKHARRLPQCEPRRVRIETLRHEGNPDRGY
jgi:hypothetical protein